MNDVQLKLLEGGRCQGRLPQKPPVQTSARILRPIDRQTHVADQDSCSHMCTSTLLIKSLRLSVSTSPTFHLAGSQSVDKLISLAHTRSLSLSLFLSWPYYLSHPYHPQQ